MKPEEMAKNLKPSQIEYLIKLIHKKPREVFSWREVNKMFKIPPSTARTHVLLLPSENRCKMGAGKNSTTVFGTPKALAEFKSLLP